ncbi:hypothetical protein LCGC14_1235400 [marine sediment metagenome]|uniref:HNH nuclease domain-containing protein n=1 Tax=marine sediment metagenome TaxID=412755 RepID=A0A0F9LUH2_9ZZZZ
MKKTPRNVSLFWAKVSKEGSLWEGTPCWLWEGTPHGGGYGIFINGGQRSLAHRFSYELKYGPIPEGLEPDHLCRNSSCVNPLHLEAVTHRENCLRGNSFTAENIMKVNCSRGHPYDEQNTYVDPRGWRYCRVCDAFRHRLYRLNQKVIVT